MFSVSHFFFVHCNLDSSHKTNKKLKFEAEKVTEELVEITEEELNIVGSAVASTVASDVGSAVGSIVGFAEKIASAVILFCLLVYF